MYKLHFIIYPILEGQMVLSDKFTKLFTNLCGSLGKNNKSLYSALTIAVSKGTLRPTFTMLDNKQDKSSRKYTAFREGLTGAVAIVSYLITDNLVKKIAKPFCEKANILDKLEHVKPVLSLISVSVSALLIIPFICNLITKPLMDKMSKNKEYIKYPNNHNTIGFKGYPAIYKNFSYTNGNLRIGG